jgi:hypothetical protein
MALSQVRKVVGGLELAVGSFSGSAELQALEDVPQGSFWLRVSWVFRS